MDENKLLEECITIKLTPLHTLLLSETVVVVNTLIDFLLTNSCMAIEKVTNDYLVVPDYEQTGTILIQSALKAMQEVRVKIWESGKEEIGRIIPQEFEQVVGVYSVVIEEIVTKFVEMLKERGK